MRIPSGSIRVRIEPEPTEYRDAGNRNDDAPSREIGDEAGDLGALEVENRADPKNRDCQEAGFKRRRIEAEECNGITDGRNGNGDVRNQERNAIGVVGQERARFAESIFSISAHAAAIARKHAAFCESVGESRGAAGRDQPGNN